MSDTFCILSCREDKERQIEPDPVVRHVVARSKCSLRQRDFRGTCYCSSSSSTSLSAHSRDGISCHVQLQHIVDAFIIRQKRCGKYTLLAGRTDIKTSALKARDRALLRCGVSQRPSRFFSSDLLFRLPRRTWPLRGPQSPRNTARNELKRTPEHEQPHP